MKKTKMKTKTNMIKTNKLDEESEEEESEEESDDDDFKKFEQDIKKDNLIYYHKP